ncbi:hypothetical protein XI03_33775 [Bradyrhizobium sp. CCBAU 65884]|nr:hypothetical protein [Bradyrhizobium sp. CCBAU 65884]
MLWLAWPRPHLSAQALFPMTHSRAAAAEEVAAIGEGDFTVEARTTEAVPFTLVATAAALTSPGR